MQPAISLDLEFYLPAKVDPKEAAVISITSNVF